MECGVSVFTEVSVAMNYLFVLLEVFPIKLRNLSMLILSLKVLYTSAASF